LKKVGVSQPQYKASRRVRKVSEKTAKCRLSDTCTLCFSLHTLRKKEVVKQPFFVPGWKKKANDEGEEKIVQRCENVNDC